MQILTKTVSKVSHTGCVSVTITRPDKQWENAYRRSKITLSYQNLHRLNISIYLILASRPQTFGIFVRSFGLFARLDLHGKGDALALHESPSYGWNSWRQHGIIGRISSQYEDKGQMGGRVPWTQRPRVRPGEGWAPSGCTLPKTQYAMTTHNHTIPDRSPPA